MNASAITRASLLLTLLSLNASGCIFLSEDAPRAPRPEEMTPDLDMLPDADTTPDLDQLPPVSCSPACEPWQVCASGGDDALCVTNPTLARLLQWQDQAPITGRRRLEVNATISAVSPDGGPLRYGLEAINCPFHATLTEVGELSFTCPESWADTCQVRLSATWRDVTITEQRELTCVNATPQISQINLSPEHSAPIGDWPATVTCDYTFVDEDVVTADTLAAEDRSLIEWFSHGEKLGVGPVLMNPPANEPVLCRVTPHDGLVEGEPMLSAPLRTSQIVLATGALHTCALSNEDQPRLFCWGRNTLGQLGIMAGIGGNIEQPVTLVSAPFGGALSQVSAGGAQTCALSGGALWCWGRHLSLAPNAPEPAPAPTPTLQPNLTSGVTSLAVGRSHACAERMGALYCWGDNRHGQLGLSRDQLSQPSPTLVPDMSDGVRAVTVGDAHTCVIRRVAQQDKLYCWGDNTHGQLGVIDGLGGDGVLPTALNQVGGLAYRIAAGARHTCALARTSGNTQLLCWGDNDRLQLGSVSARPAYQPRAVTLPSEPLSLAAGREHTCAVLSGAFAPPLGRVWCWGDNSRGQIGQGLSQDEQNRSGLPPTQSDLDIEAAYLSISANHHTCAVYGQRLRQLKCWGDNQGGQIMSAGATQPTPTEIVLPN